ncbi:putative endoribonuclease L-PSP [Hoylesella marshii DSM 16973 = JCM 13450]|uniref:Endoribonuclease L-PSP n=2 Tax=Hoylesella marshii TaxID=189722 RepID=E0NRC8_9BACT|nr:putative endoribonuclease L-PSP [Hoylesella marshii DSM 16973 = JCM 13450]
MPVISYLCTTYKITFKQIKNMKTIHTEQAPKAVGPYSQAIEAGGFVFASGQLPIDPATGAFAEGGIKEQTRQSLTNAQAVLRAAGIDLTHVVKTTVFLSDIDNFAAMNEVYAEFFKEPYPARSAFAVKTLPKGALVEVECIAEK